MIVKLIKTQVLILISSIPLFFISILIELNNPLLSKLIKNLLATFFSIGNSITTDSLILVISLILPSCVYAMFCLFFVRKLDKKLRKLIQAGNSV